MRSNHFNGAKLLFVRSCFCPGLTSFGQCGPRREFRAINGFEHVPLIDETIARAPLILLEIQAASALRQQRF